ncbi:MAG: dihydrofolate reductase family protein [Streptococcaceae bacterium]|jgi:dihydrofolate reductase|nr:dihydrofolate reductase family protein [Streptococcaceae bacterium]
MIKLFIAATLDGYIATADDRLDWLFEVSGDGDNGYGDFIATIDTLVMGKKTYDWLMREQPEAWPYADKKTFVLTRAVREPDENVTFITDLEPLEQLTETIWLVGGGEIIRLFLEAGLVDDFQVTLAPVLLGRGKPLFPAGNYQKNLQLIGTKTYGQFVELHYKTRQS